MGDRLTKFCDVKIKRGKNEVECGKPVPNDEATTLTYGTTRFEMDLCADHIADLESKISPFTSIAHAAQKRTNTAVRKAIAGKRGKAFTTADVREWLRAQGREVSSTGRLPDNLLREYQDAQK
ncbi:histone-like nucleoid-structuring protein Lsr2 [Streptomyces sp. NPDC006631]|uniref:Lsr2 family DNA-binding protein n=1 Tax=Streptomyces sp. NPDC006631 TaxID=3364752 RepID=UPI003698C52B